MRMLILATAFAALLTSTEAIAQQSQQPMTGQQTPGAMMAHGMMGPNMMGPNMMGPNMMGPNMMGPGTMGQGLPGYGTIGQVMPGCGTPGYATPGYGMMGPGTLGQGVPGYGMPAYGMMGQGVPSYGMPGYGMMGQGFVEQGMMPMMGMMDPAQQGEVQLAYLKGALAITEAQASQWDAYAEALRANAKRMGEMMALTLAGRGTMGMMPVQSYAGASVLDRLDNAERHMNAHLDMMKTIKGPTTQLYNALSDEQKRLADQLLPPRGMMGMM